MGLATDDFGADRELVVRAQRAEHEDVQKTLPIINPAAWQGRQPPEREWALDGWIPARQASYLTGAGSAGKSLLGQQLCTSIALGRPFMGVETRQGRALYITCEDDEAELWRRQAAICDALDVKLADLHAKLFLASLAGWSGTALCTFDESGRLVRTEAYEMLRLTAERTSARFITLDNVAHLFGGNENIRNEVASFVSVLNGLALETNGSVLLIGHPNKAGADFSGSTAWENQVRSRLFLKVDEDDSDRRELTAPKANYAAKGGKLEFRWHRGAFVRDSDIPADLYAAMAAVSATNREDDIFMECLAAATKAQQAVSQNPGTNYYAAIFPRMREAKKQPKAVFERAFQRLLVTGRIELDAKLWQRANRTWKFGIKCTDHPHRPAHQPLAPTAPTTSEFESAPTCTDPARTDPYIYIDGAASGDGAPSLNNDDCPSCDGMGCDHCDVPF